jgi:hypothetical protein
MQGNTATTYLVDTNVLSNRRDVEADPNVIEWLRRHGGQIRISVVTVAEIRRGLLLLEARLTRTADSRVRRGAQERLDRKRECTMNSPDAFPIGSSRSGYPSQNTGPRFPSLRDSDNAMLATALVNPFNPDSWDASWDDDPIAPMLRT